MILDIRAFNAIKSGPLFFATEYAEKNQTFLLSRTAHLPANSLRRNSVFPHPGFLCAFLAVLCALCVNALIAGHWPAASTIQGPTSTQSRKVRKENPGNFNLNVGVLAN